MARQRPVWVAQNGFTVKVARDSFKIPGQASTLEVPPTQQCYRLYVQLFQRHTVSSKVTQGHQEPGVLGLDMFALYDVSLEFSELNLHPLQRGLRLTLLSPCP